MSLLPIVLALGGDLYAGGRRANVPAPGHGAADRSVSLLLSGNRVVVHGFGGAGWREVLDDLRRRGLIDRSGAPSSRCSWSVTTSVSPSRADRLLAARSLWEGGLAIAPSTESARHINRRGVRRPLPGSEALRRHRNAPLSVYREGGRTQPALMAAVSGSAGDLTAVELTYLDAVGRRAVGLRLPRKTVGLLPPGSAVRLDPIGPELLVAEGVFTALSATERFDLPGWALLSTSNLRRWSPPDGVRRVLVAADRGRDGQASAVQLASRLRAAGVSVRVRLPPPPFEDWNDAASPVDGVREMGGTWRGKEGPGRARRTGRMGLPGRRGRASMSDPVPFPASIPRVCKSVPLRDLGVAPGNMRHGEPADAEIPQLAETILAAGVLQPLTVRPGRRKERPFMALDGRRRLLALERLLETGQIDGGYLVDVFEETDPERQAAALLLTNIAVPVHVADVVAAIGKMLKRKLTVAQIARALGYAEVEIRRLAALSGLHAKALQALKEGKLTLSQARLLSRLSDAPLQAEIAAQALAGLGFQGWRVSERLERGRVTALDRRFALVGAERYVAAGGRVEADLFGELPDQLLDAELLTDLWTACVRDATGALEAQGVAVHLSGEGEAALDGALEPLGYVSIAALTEERQAEHQAALATYREHAAGVRSKDLASDDGPSRLAAMLAAKLAAERVGQPGRVIRAAVLWPAGALGADCRFYADPTPLIEQDDGEADGDAREVGFASPWRRDPVVVPDPQPVPEGVGHALHEARTDMATRGLIRALADDPGAALVALVARLFTALVLDSARLPEASAVSLVALAYHRPKHPPIEALDGEVRRRLAERRAAWTASGLRPIPWVAALPHGERMSLLAELTALSLNVREDKTSMPRPAARADAAEIAALTCADIAAYWTPDEAFLKVHRKKHLLAMLDTLGVDDERARTLKHGELAVFVAERAAERGWAPAEVGWLSEPADEAAAEAFADEPDVAGSPPAPVDGCEAETAFAQAA